MTEIAEVVSSFLGVFVIQRRRKIFNLWVPSVKAEDQKKKKKRSPAYVTALLESLTALLEYLNLFSNI